MRQFFACKAFINLMKNSAREQQVLECDTFLRPCPEENVFRRLPGRGQNKMSKGKYQSQTFIHICRLLKLRVKISHLRFDRWHLQLRPGISLQIELNVFMREIEWIEAEIRQDARSFTALRHNMIHAYR